MQEHTERKVPQIRFKGFKEEWEEELLGDIYTKIRNAFVGTATPYYTDKGHFYLQSNNVKNGEINRNTEVFINEYFYQNQKDKWLRANDIVMVQSGHVGHTAVISEELDNTAAHALIIISRPARDISSYFVNFYLQGNRAKRDLANITTGNTIKHILASEIKRFGVFFTHPTEQTQIGKYFRELDSLIALHQRKHDKLLALKKAMLQKMFPQPGVSIPEIRFKGFAGDWVTKNLSEICDETYGGGTPRTAERKFWEGMIPWIQSSDITDGEIYKVTPRKYINDLALRKSPTKLIPQNSIAIVTRVAVGKLALMEFSYAASQDFLSLSKLKLDQSFAVVALSILLESKLHETQGTSIKGITKEELLAYSLKIPYDTIEQQKIGTYFRTLDRLISKHAIQLQKLQQIKSACLEKMFV